MQGDPLRCTCSTSWADAVAVLHGSESCHQLADLYSRAEQSVETVSCLRAKVNACVYRPAGLASSAHHTGQYCG